MKCMFLVFERKKTLTNKLYSEFSFFGKLLIISLLDESRSEGSEWEQVSGQSWVTITGQVSGSDHRV